MDTNKIVGAIITLISLDGIKVNDVVLINMNNIPPPEERNRIMDQFKNLPKGTSFFFALPGESIEVFSEAEMNKLGWFRKETF